MAQAPYSPIPDVTEQAIGAPMQRVNADSEMFGSSVGQAYARIGAATEGAGDEVWNRAIAFQQLDQETRATQAATQYQEGATQSLEQFRSLQGSNASPEALSAYQKDLEDQRTQMRDNLPSPYAQKIFDSDSLTMQGRLFSYGADHAAQQMDVFNKQVDQGTINAHISAVQANAQDDGLFASSLKAAQDTLEQQQLKQGLPQTTIDANKNQLGSAMAAERIISMSKIDTQRAHDMLGAAKNDGSMIGDDLAKASDAVTKQMNEVTSRNTSNAIYSGQLPVLGRQPVDIGRAKDAVGGYESGNTYDRLGPVVRGGQYDGEQALGRYQVMPGNLPEWLHDAGMPNMTPQEFLHSNSAQDELFEKRFGQYQTQYGSFNEAVSHWFTGKSYADAQAAGATDHYHTIDQYVMGTNANLAKSAPLSDLVNAGRTAANEQAPDLPSVADHTEQRIIQQNNEQEQIKKADDAKNWNTINGVLYQGGVSGVNSIADIRKSSPEAAAAVDALDDTGHLKLQKDITAMQKEDVPLTNQRQALSFKLQGQAQTDPSGFEKVDIAQLDLPRAEKQRLFGIKTSIEKGQNADPEVGRTMPFISQMMNSAGLTDKTDDDYKTFMGAYSNSLKDFQATNGKGPNPDQAQNIARQLLVQHSTGGWFGGTKGQFETDHPIAVPDKIYTQAKAAYPTWSDEQIQRVYMKSLYTKLHNPGQPNGQ